MQRSIQYGDTKIDFTIHFAPRSQRRLTIHVLPDGTVQVDAPESTESDEVVAAVRHRARWIWQQLEAHRLRRRHVLPREYVSGESHFYLGRRHLLKVIPATDGADSVKMLRGRLEVVTKSTAPVHVCRLLDGWYRERAAEVFCRRLAELQQHITWVSEPPALRLLNMQTQWGSCSPQGTLLLNPHLVKAPRPCIDYVLCHELCHLKEHNHSENFYRLLTGLLPDWASLKRELDNMAELLLNH